MQVYQQHSFECVYFKAADENLFTQRRNTMKNISLIKISIIVIIAALASNFVSANDEVQEMTPHISFSSLLNALDSNKNGFLDRSEVLNSENDALKSAFSDIDSNSDSKISEDEFNSYLAKASN